MKTNENKISEGTHRQLYFCVGIVNTNIITKICAIALLF